MWCGDSSNVGVAEGVGVDEGVVRGLCGSVSVELERCFVFT